VTAEAARRVGGNEAFWKMHDELFENPKGFASHGQEFVKEATARIGIDHDELWSNIRTRSIWERIRGNADQGNALEVKATPTLFFDGRRMAKWGDRLIWKYLLEHGSGEAAPASQPSDSSATAPAAQTQ
jgi:protein-disulfide isomerase